MAYLKKILKIAENSHTSFTFWALSFLSLIIIRILIENWISYFKDRSGLFLFYEFAHTLLFFLISYLIFLWFFTKTLKESVGKISNILLLGFLLVLFPPLIDTLISGGSGFWSFYDFGGLRDLMGYFFSFFDDTPKMGITYGVRIEVFLAVIFLFLYSYLKSKGFLKSLLIAVASYAIFFILGTFPSWITIIVKGFTKGFLSVGEMDIVQLFLTPAVIFSREITDIISSLNIKMSIIYSLVLTLLILTGLYFNYRKKLFFFLKNSRPAQLIYHGGLLCMGLGLGFIINKENPDINFFNIISFAVLLISVFCAWLASVVLNDFTDKEIDEKTNVNRPLIKNTFSENEYRIIGIVLFVVSIFFSAIISFKVAFLLIVYQAIAWFYSSWPLRLKRFAFVSTFIGSLASLMIFFSGYILASPDQNIRNFPLNILLLLVVGYTLSLPVKDFKDISGDKDAGVYTVPVLFGEEWGKIIIGSGIFISYLLSVVLLNEFRLFWWAIVFGGLSFWIVIKMKKSPESTRIDYQNIIWWILGLVFAYGVILVKIMFL